MKNSNRSVSDKIKNFIINETFNKQEFVDILTDSFGRYAKHIIQNRALPNYKDGLKPVHRRTLYAMAEGLKLTHKSNYKKSARVVGEVIGKYHPHGDNSVYAALVRMSQPWKMRYPFIDFHGNNGSIDGDPPAAMRYTEVRLSKYAEALFKDTKKELVPFINNFDDTELEPLYFPSLLPNFFINGNSGIAAGYSTNIPPHNLGEMIDGLISFIKNPESTVSELLKIIKGPDFPTAGIINNSQDLTQIYETGKGKIIVSGRIFVKSDTDTLHYLEITEIPYDIPKTLIVKQIENFRANQAYDLITKIIDLSDKNGIRIIVGIKNLKHAETLKNLLFKKTSLRIQYSCNFVVIIDAKPKEVGILDYFKVFIKFLFGFHRTKYGYQLKLLEEKQVILEGFMKMVSILDQVIKVIRTSNTRQDAITNLIKNFSFLKIQATAIVELKLYRLTSTDILSLKEEYQKNIQSIKRLTSLLKHKRILTDQIIKNLENLKFELNDQRLTEIRSDYVKINQEIEEQIFINKNDYLLIISSSSYIWTDEITSKDKTNGKQLPRIKSSDYVAFKGVVKYNQEVIVLTKSGYIVSLPVVKLNKSKESENGIFLPAFTKNLPPNSPTLAIITYKNESPEFHLNQYFLVVTKLGKVKLLQLDNFLLSKKMYAKKIINLTINEKIINEEDQIIYCEVANYLKDNLLLITTRARYLLFPINNIKVSTFNSRGQSAVKLKDNEKISFALNIQDLKVPLLFLSEKYRIKEIIPMSDLIVSERGKTLKSFRLILPKSFNIKTIFFNSPSAVMLNVGNNLGVASLIPLTEKLNRNFYKSQIQIWKKNNYSNFNFSFTFSF